MYHSFRRFFLAYLPFILWYGGITWLSSQPNLPGPGDNGIGDFMWFKTAHILAYTGLSFWLWIGTFFWWQKIQYRFRVLWMIVLMLALLDEFHQSFVPGRTPRLTDIGIDMLGSTAVIFMLERYNAVHSFAKNWRKTLGM